MSIFYLPIKYEENLTMIPEIKPALHRKLSEETLFKSVGMLM